MALQVEGHACITQLLNAVYEWLGVLDTSKPVHALYLDFEKAFDTVPHRRLMNKLNIMVSEGICLAGFMIFLAIAHSTLNNEVSDKNFVISGDTIIYLLY